MLLKASTYSMFHKETYHSEADLKEVDPIHRIYPSAKIHPDWMGKKTYVKENH